jgi:hypothetical protein
MEVQESVDQTRITCAKFRKPSTDLPDGQSTLFLGLELIAKSYPMSVFPTSTIQASLPCKEEISLYPFFSVEAVSLLPLTLSRPSASLCAVRPFNYIVTRELQGMAAGSDIKNLFFIPENPY